MRRCIKRLGYKNPSHFADAKRYRITYVYKWLNGTTPDPDNLFRLAKDFNVNPAWLLFGDSYAPTSAPVPRRRPPRAAAAAAAHASPE
jgi:hypothetical protein